MCSYTPDVSGQLWQHVLGGMDSTIDIANQMRNDTVPVRNTLANPGERMWILEAPRYNEVRIAPLTTENLALHDQSMVEQRGLSPVKTSTLRMKRGG